MKILLVTLSLFFARSASAALLDITGLADLVAEKAKETRAVSLINLDAQVSAGAELPIWVLQGADGTQYLGTGIGADIKSRENFRPLISIDANLPALSSVLWSSEWAKVHVKRTHFPPIWFGPNFRVPLPEDRFQFKDIRNYLGFIVSIGIGSGSK